MKKYIFPVIYGAVLALFTVYVLLDTFTIKRVYRAADTDESGKYSSYTPTDDSPAAGGQSGSDDGRTYRDGNIQIEINEYTENGTAVYAADIKLSSAEYLKTAFAQNLFGKNIRAKTSDIAAGHGAVLAINGDFYGSRDGGCVLRNGVLYRDGTTPGQEDLAIYDNGDFRIFDEQSVDTDALLSEGVTQVLSFGPALVDDGRVTVGTDYEVGKAMASNPRTAIGIISPLHYVFVVSDGRTAQSRGLSLYELAGFMLDLGVRTAYNLDGGGSSTMYFKGEVINRPTTNGRISEREVSDIVYIGYD